MSQFRNPTILAPFSESHIHHGISHINIPFSFPCRPQPDLSISPPPPLPPPSPPPCLRRCSDVGSFAAQPVILSKLLLLFLYTYLLSLGLRVYQGRHTERAKFVKDNQAGKGQQPVPIATAHYFFARWHVFGVCFSALAPTLAEWDVLPIGHGVSCAWGASFLWVVWQEVWLGEQAARSFSPWATNTSGFGKGWWEKRTTQRWWLYVSLLPLAILLCVGGGFALVGVPVFLLIKLTYRGADRLITVP